MVRVRAVEHPLEPRIGDLVAREFAVLVLVERHHPRNKSVRRRRFVDLRIGRGLRPAVARFLRRLGECDRGGQSNAEREQQDFANDSHGAFLQVVESQF